MKENAPEAYSHETEMVERNDLEKSIRELPGFVRLSERQQRYLLGTLYIQQRAVRGTDAKSAARIQKMPDNFKDFGAEHPYIALPTTPWDHNKSTDNYVASQRMIMRDSCHGVVRQLEGYTDHVDTSIDWIEAGPINSYADLCELIDMYKQQHQFPAIIQTCPSPRKIDAEKLIHTTVLLGNNSENIPMVWEKMGFHLPFLVQPLEKTYAPYSKYTGWRIRPLSV